MARKLLRMAVGLYLLVAAPARAQDLEDVLAGVPIIGAALLEALRQAPDFMAKVEVQWTSQSSPKLATATGLCAWQHGHFRWDVNLRQVTGPLLSSQTLDVVNRMRLEPIVLLALADAKRCDLLLAGAKAFLESPLPQAASINGRQHVRLGSEMLDGRRCAKEKFSLLGKRKIDVLLWNSQDQEIAPAKMQMSVERMKLVVRFQEVRPARLTSSQFQIPSGYTKYTQFDDLVQSLLWDGIKSGLTSRASK